VLGALREPVHSLVDAVREALGDLDYDQSYNRRLVTEYHDPAPIARALVAAVGRA
jgi:hypothetical protein